MFCIERAISGWGRQVLLSVLQVISFKVLSMILTKKGGLGERNMVQNIFFSLFWFNLAASN